MSMPVRVCAQEIRFISHFDLSQRIFLHIPSAFAALGKNEVDSGYKILSLPRDSFITPVFPF